MSPPARGVARPVASRRPRRTVPLGHRPAVRLALGGAAQGRVGGEHRAPRAPWRARTGARPRSPGRRSPCTRSAARRRRCRPPRCRPRRRSRSRSRAPRASSRSASPRAARSASPAGSSRGDGRAEDAQRGVALELVHQPALGLDHLDHDAEEAVEQAHDLGRRHRQRHRGRADDVDEQRRRSRAPRRRARAPSGAPPARRPRRPGGRTGRGSARARAGPRPSG